MQQLSGDLIRHQLPTYTFGQNVVYTQQTGSTNTELKQLARGGAPEGLLYITDEQLVGRGRREKSWLAPAGSSLLMSLLFRPGPILTADQGHHLTMLCALALADAVRMKTDIEPRLKWPNDLVWKDGKKLAGLLTESEFAGDQLAWVVVGTGLNVNIDFQKNGINHQKTSGNGDAPLAETATSLSMILHKNAAHLRLPILQKYLFNVEQRYKALQQGWSPHQEWRDRLLGLGQTITVIGPDGRRHQGIMTDVNENGSLLLKNPDETITEFLVGDVSLRL